MRILSVVSLLFCVLLSGCGDGSLRVSGKVTFPDGSPLTQGTVVFDSGNYTNKAVLDTNGQYNVGVPAGQYKVYFTFTSLRDETFVPPPDEPDAQRYIDLIHPSYATLNSTTLSCDISRGGQQDFTVEPPEKK